MLVIFILKLVIVMTSHSGAQPHYYNVYSRAVPYCDMTVGAVPLHVMMTSMTMVPTVLILVMTSCSMMLRVH